MPFFRAFADTLGSSFWWFDLNWVRTAVATALSVHTLERARAHTPTRMRLLRAAAYVISIHE